MKLLRASHLLNPILITTVYVDHVLSKIDVGIEQFLIGVENSERFSHDTRSESRFRFSTPKIGAVF